MKKVLSKSIVRSMFISKLEKFLVSDAKLASVLDYDLNEFQ